MREGSVIGAYRVLRRIGEGGMGAVYLAEHTLLRRRAAIKVLLPALSSKRESVDRFFNEARAATVISDPGIVQVFDFGFTTDNVAYIVMELLEGESLGARLHRLRALAPVDALRIARQVAGSLGAAHAAGIIHRDLKPDNLFMIRDPEALGGERPKILDFGIAKLDDDAADRMRTQTGAVLGTPVYMSPEQCDGLGRIDYRADIYSLGCVLFHLVVGRPPFDLGGVGAVISAHLREPPPAPSTRMAPLPDGFDELVLRCLSKSPADRFASMAELQHACDAILTPLIVGGAATVPATPHSFPVPPLPMQMTPPPMGSHGGPSWLQNPTTLGGAAGQSAVGQPRRRLGKWVTISVLAGGAGALLAVLTARHDAKSTAAAPAAPAVSAAAAPALPAATPDAPAAATAPVAADPVAVAPTVPVDAGADAAAAITPETAAAKPTEPVDQGRPAAAHKPTSKSPPPKRHRPDDDVYDERN